jgi:hypothetical protein
MSVTIVGAGPGGLACALALRCHDPSIELTVLDPAGSWLHAWRRRFAQQDIPHLRSPAVHHPHPDPFALLATVTRRELVTSGRTTLPTSRSFDRFCDELIDAGELRDLVRSVRVTGIASSEADASVLELDDGTTHRAARVVLATNPRIPVQPVPLVDAIAAGAVLPAERADVRTTPAGGHVVVVGGGLSAGHLALGAVRRGARVTMLTRRRVTVRRFDTHPTWLGPKKLRPFAAEPDPQRRRAQVDRARGGGTIPHAIRHELAACETAGLLELHERAVLRGCDPQPDGRVCVHLADRTLPPADAVWVAAGGTIDVDADPVCRDLAAAHPTTIAGGMPVLADDLSWPGTRIHLAGFTAALTLGPTAGNLIGLRRAAQRIGAAVRGQDPVQADRITTGGGACPSERLRAGRPLGPTAGPHP